MITRHQWDTLQAGDVLVAPTGRERKVVSARSNGYIALMTVYSFPRETGYVFSDLCHTHSVKPSERNCRVKRIPRS